MKLQQSELREFIVQQCRQSPELLGSRLGNLIQEHFRGQSGEIDAAAYIKNHFGGLKQFIAEECKDEVVLIRKSGSDNVYAHISNVDAPMGIVGNSHSNKTSPWRAFSNPNLAVDIIVSPETGEIQVWDFESQPPDSFLRVGKLTREDYREMARDFLPRISQPEVRVQLSDVLKADEFWSQWSLILNSHKNDGVYTSWIRWRNGEIVTRFRAALVSASLPHNIVEMAVRSLEESHVKVPPRESSKFMYPRKPVLPEASRDTSSSIQRNNNRQEDIWALMHSAIDRMSEDELRQIRLPVGVILDVIKEKFV